MTEPDTVPAAAANFDPLVLKAMAKWPDVPACYGWLALDRRGHWRLQGEVISHPRAVAFLNQHYTRADDGSWYVQNGPQRVFVDLAYTPFICREAAPGRLVTHVGKPVESLPGIVADEEHNLVLLTEYGPALLDDRDLLSFTGALALPDGSASGDRVLGLLVGDEGTPPFRLCWHSRTLDVLRLSAAELPLRYGYVREPRPAA